MSLPMALLIAFAVSNPIITVLLIIVLFVWACSIWNEVAAWAAKDAARKAERNRRC